MAAKTPSAVNTAVVHDTAHAGEKVTVFDFNVNGAGVNDTFSSGITSITRVAFKSYDGTSAYRNALTYDSAGVITFNTNAGNTYGDLIVWSHS